MILRSGLKVNRRPAVPRTKPKAPSLHLKAVGVDLGC